MSIQNCTNGNGFRVEAKRSSDVKRRQGKFEFIEAYAELADLGQGLRGGVMLVTPEMAAEWLDRLRPRQRRVRKPHVNSIAGDIVAGRWRLNGEPFVFDCYGRLANAQHRAWAIIKANMAVLAMVIVNVDDSAYATFDITARRRGGDALASAGIHNSSAVAAAAGLLKQYQATGTVKKNSNLSPIEIEEIVAANPGLETSAKTTHGCRVICRGVSAATFAHFVFSEIDPDAADLFIAKLADGDNLLKGEPIFMLRRFLVNAAASRKYVSHEHMVILLFKTWNAWRAGKPIGVLRVDATDKVPAPI